MSIRVLVADDHPLVRQGIKRILNFEDGLEVIGEAKNGKEALERTLELQPDILLLDLNMPVMSGLEVMKRLKAAKCPTKVVALTIYDSDAYVLEMLKYGAMGYLLKGIDPQDMVKSIILVNKGECYLQPSIAKRFLARFGKTENLHELANKVWSKDGNEHITDRERDVMKYIVKGYSNIEISEELGLSEKTVKNHVASLIHKLKVRNRTQIVIYALKHKLMSLD
jgi:DNA-binding NarL/FixJ family response regulator